MSSVGVEAPLFAGRYRVEQTLGEGGVGVVELVTDVRSGQKLALKRLLSKRVGQQREAVMLLFQREYHVLAQLAHPNIIDAIDYGVADGEPYYTMELLDGNDLRQLAPMPWQPACEILLDVCSALALLHSRGLVHRDLTPANVRRTSDGRTKLIDFGAMALMGQATDLVGTPPYMAPELVHGQALDGRADLYALGAVGYWLLTGQHAFPARKMSQLRDLWRSLPVRISVRHADVPPVLEQLVMSLLSLDPLARPRNAAEVVQRLSALVGRQPQVQLSAAQAYLTTPMLVGRTQEQIEFRKRALGAKSGQGAHVLVRSAAGTGRSRLLEAYALEGKLAGMLVARVRSNAISDDEHAALASLVRSIQAALPEEVAWSDEEQAAFSSLSAGGVRAANEKLYDTLDAWFLGIVRRYGLLLLLDDTHLYDAASLMVLARWARQAINERLLVISSVNSDAQARHAKPHHRFVERSLPMSLHALSGDDNLKLLASLFGDVAQLRPVAEWTYRVAQGNPRMTMDLAQHLVDRKIVVFSEGAWHLPDSLETLSLPANFQQALDDRIAQLPAMARALVQGLCLVTPHAPLELNEYIQLLGDQADANKLFLALDALLAAQVLVRVGDRYLFRQQATIEAVRRTLSEDEARTLHLRLAIIYDQSARQTQVLAAWHRYSGGQLETAYIALRDRIAEQEDVRFVDERTARSPQGAELCLRCLEYALEHSKGERDLYIFRRALGWLGGTSNPALARYAGDMLPQLLRQSGMIHWQSMDPSMDPAERTQRCLQIAADTYEKTPPAERWMEPAKAIDELALAVMSLTSSYSSTWDAERLAKLPDIMRPLRALSPALAFLGDICEMSAAGIALGAYVGTQRRALFEQLLAPIVGMPEPIRRGTLSIFRFYVGLDDSAFNHQGALEQAAELDKQPFYAGLACLVRMFYFLNRGEYRAAEEARVQMELHSLRDLANDQHFTAGLIYEAGALTRFGDLLGFKRLLPAFDAWAERFDGWRPWAMFIRAHYALARGEIDKAAELMAAAEPYMEPFRHGIWQHLYTLQMRVLLAQDKPEEALAVSARLEAALAARGVATTDPWSYGGQLCIALARAGRTEEAARRYDIEIQLAEQVGLAPMLLASCYETRARIALCMRDLPSFRDYAARTDALLRPGGHPAAMAFFDRLMSDARKLDGFLETTQIIEQGDLGPEEQQMLTMVATLRTQFMESENPKERAQAALAMLVEESNAQGGYLFVFSRGGLSHLASLREGLPPNAIIPEIQRYLGETLSNVASHEKTRTHTETNTVTADPDTVTYSFGDADGMRYSPLLLRSYDGNRAFAVGVVVLRTKQGEKPNAPWMLLSALAHALLESGDAQRSSLRPPMSLS